MEELDNRLVRCVLNDVPLFALLLDTCEEGLYKSTLTGLLLLGVDELFNGIVFIGEFWGVSSLIEKKFSFEVDEKESLLL